MGNPGTCVALAPNAPPSPERVHDVLQDLARSVSTSERQFEERCRQFAESADLASYGFGRQSIRDASLHGLSAHKLATLHEVCGVRFGSLVSELTGICLNDLAHWHAAAYPDQTIRLPDYLWNPEALFRCPISLCPAATPAR